MAEGFQDEDIPETLDDSSSEADSLSSFFERFTFRGLGRRHSIETEEKVISTTVPKAVAWRKSPKSRSTHDSQGDDHVPFAD